MKRGSKYFDARIKRSEENPWICIDVTFLERFITPLTLTEIKELPLGVCPLIMKGSRLSLMPLTKEQYDMMLQEIERKNENMQGGKERCAAKGPPSKKPRNKEK